MVRLMLVLAPVTCVVGAIAISATLDNYLKPLKAKKVRLQRFEIVALVLNVAGRIEERHQIPHAIRSQLRSHHRPRSHLGLLHFPLLVGHI